MRRFFKSWEPQYVKRNTIIQIVIFTLTFIALASIWPFHNYHNHDWVKQQAFSNNDQQPVGENFTINDKKLQTIAFTKNHIYQMRMYMSAVTYDETNFVYFRLYDQNFSCIYDEEIGCNLIARDGFANAVIDMDVEVGLPYYYEVIVAEQTDDFGETKNVIMSVPTAAPSSLGQAENGTLYIDGIINNEQALIADFDYGTNLKAWQIIGYDFIVLVIAFAFYVIVFWLLEVTKPYYGEIKKGFCYLITVLSIVALLAFWYLSLVKNAFGDQVLDKVFYALGSLVALAWLMTRIWIDTILKRNNPMHLMSERNRVANNVMISRTWRNAIQIICFGLLFYALCMYVNAYVEYLHTNNTRWMLILMGIALLMIRSEKELFRLRNYVWTAISLAVGIYYCMGAETGQPKYLAKLTVATVIIWGLVCIQLLTVPKKGIWRKINKPFFFVWVCFILLSYLYRFEKTWVFTASLPFLAILLYNLNADEKKRLLQNFTSGIMFSFWLITFYNLCHRPYHYWIYYRYSGMFHTVACTGLYLSIVIAATLASLLGKWKNKKELLPLGYFELFTLMVAGSYVVLSMTRTAIFSIAEDVVLIMILTIIGYQKSVKRVCKEVIAFGILIILTFPMVFSAQRIVPAIVNQPEYYIIENRDRIFAIYEGEEWDSSKYMTVERFISLFTGRIQSGDAGKNLNAKLVMEDDQNLLATIAEDKLPVVFAQGDTSELEEKDDISNGRLDIFRLYLSKVSFKGNPGTILADENGVENAHAHNSYIMVAYNFGVIAGILFLALCLLALISSIDIFMKKCKKSGVYLVPFSILIVFGLTGLTEWTFHPCFSTGYAFLFLLPLLVQKEVAKKTN